MATAAHFRALALALPDAEPGEHQRREDFRIGGRIFASLPHASTGMIVLAPARQHERLAANSRALQPATGAWGRQGCTMVTLDAVDQTALRELLTDAWQHLQAKLALRKQKK